VRGLRPDVPPNALRLVRRETRVIPPLSTTHRTVVMAIERGQLADLLFDDRTLASHRILGAVLGAVLKLPPVGRSLAREQVKSRYLEALLARWPDGPPRSGGSGRANSGVCTGSRWPYLPRASFSKRGLLRSGSKLGSMRSQPGVRR